MKALYPPINVFSVSPIFQIYATSLVFHRPRRIATPERNITICIKVLGQTELLTFPSLKAEKIAKAPISLKRSVALHTAGIDNILAEVKG